MGIRSSLEKVREQREQSRPEDPAVASREAARRLRSTLFAQQRAMVDDQGRFKAALCTRRAGKTWGVVAYLIVKALTTADATCLYVSLSRLHAKGGAWMVATKMVKNRRLKCDVNRQELSLTFANGSRVIFSGADTDDSVDRFRGLGCDLVVIDECQSFRGHLKKLVLEVIRPTLMDRAGTLVMSGTPGWVPAGYWYDTCESPESAFSQHRWSVLDNSTLPVDPRKEVEAVKRENGWSDDNPIYQREWLGKWVTDTDVVCYKFDPLKNLYDGTLPEGHVWYHVLGFDYGFTDACAFSVWAWSPTHPACFEVESSKITGMTSSAAATAIDQLNRRYGFTHIVGDYGGGGRSVIEEVRTKFRTPMELAEKRDKIPFIRMMSSELIESRVFARRGSPLVEEWRTLQWNKKKLDQGILKEGEGENHCCDAALYAWRKMRHMLAVTPEDKPVPGSREWASAEEKRIEQAFMDRVRVKREEEEFDRVFSDDDPWGEAW